MKTQLAFHINSSICTGCKACQIACNDKNNLPVGLKWRKVVQYGSGSWQSHPTQPGVYTPNNIYAYTVAFACNHCEKPICVEVCPTQAMHKRDDGVVLIDAEKCIGCRYCEWACPYGEPQFNETVGKMTKCNFCEDLLAKGENPACVDACVMRAIEFGEIGEMRSKFGTVSAVEPLPEANVTFPSVVITPHKHSQVSGQGTGRILGLIQEA